MKLEKLNDPMGLAVQDYFENGKADTLRVCSTTFDDDEMPISHLFRLETNMPPLERRALQLCKGNVLDVGAGAGCHSLALQRRGLNVTAIDISPLSVEVMRRQGVSNALWADFFTDDIGNNYQTILLLMNGLGIAGTLKRLPALLSRCKQLLAPNGCILADSTDLRYVFEDEDGTFEPPFENRYYGEVDFRMEYKNCKGDPFDWLYVDFDTLTLTATQSGLHTQLVERGEHYDYLAKIY